MSQIVFSARFPLMMAASLVISQLVACSSEQEVGGIGVDTGGTLETDTITAVSASQMAWVMPSEREDNTPISLTEIAGYRIYFGDTRGDYPNQIEINDAYDNDFDINDMNLPAGTYYAVVTTVDSDGRESAYSDEVVLSI